MKVFKKTEKKLKKKVFSKMPVFNFPQSEHEPFCRYLSRLNDYHTQLNQPFAKWEIYEVIVLGLNAKFRGVVELYVQKVC